MPRSSVARPSTLNVEMGASFGADDAHYVFSRRHPPASVPTGVQFVKEPISAFAERLRKQAGKNIWMMGGGEIIGSFLDQDAIDRHESRADVYRGRHSPHRAEASCSAAALALREAVS